MPTCIWQNISIYYQYCIPWLQPLVISPVTSALSDSGQILGGALPLPVLGGALSLSLILQSRVSCREHKTWAVRMDSLSWRISEAGSRPVQHHQPWMSDVLSWECFFSYSFTSWWMGSMQHWETERPLFLLSPLLLPSFFSSHPFSSHHCFLYGCRQRWTHALNPAALVSMGPQSLTADFDESWQWAWEWE